MLLGRSLGRMPIVARYGIRVPQNSLGRRRSFAANSVLEMETKIMSGNPHSVVHARQYADVEKTKDEQPRKSEPGVKGMVSHHSRESFAPFFGNAAVGWWWTCERNCSESGGLK